MPALELSYIFLDSGFWIHCQFQNAVGEMAPLARLVPLLAVLSVLLALTSASALAPFSIVAYLPEWRYEVRRSHFVLHQPAVLRLTIRRFSVLSAGSQFQQDFRTLLASAFVLARAQNQWRDRRTRPLATSRAASRRAGRGRGSRRRASHLLWRQWSLCGLFGHGAKRKGAAPLCQISCAPLRQARIARRRLQLGVPGAISTDWHIFRRRLLFCCH